MHQPAAAEQRQRVANAGASDAAFATKRFEQFGAQITRRELTNGVQNVAAALGCHDLAVHQVLLDVRRLQQTTADREHAAGAAVRRVEGARFDLIRPQGPGIEHLLQFLERQDLVDIPGHCGTRGLGPFGDTGPDEDDGQIVSVHLPRHAGRSHHRRHDRSQRADELGIVLLHVAGHGGTSRGDEAATVRRTEQPSVLASHQVRPETNLQHEREPQLPQHSCELLMADVRKGGGETRRQAGRHAPAGPQQTFQFARRAADLLGVL